MSGEKFGEFVRRERGAKDIGLREMAKMIGSSPTYLLIPGEAAHHNEMIAPTVTE
jgi:hypothetical protein